MLSQSIRFCLLLLTLLLSVACSTLVENVPDREQIGELADRSRDALATARAAQPTVQAAIATARVQIGTAAVQAEAIATQVAAGGTSALATIQALGTPVTTLRDRLAQLQPNADGSLTITITEAELTAALTWDEPAEDDRLRNVRARIAEGMLVISADVVDPVTAPASIRFEPVIEDSALQLHIIDARLGSVPLPTALLNASENRLNRTLLTAINLIPGENIFTQVSAENGVLVLFGYRQ
jgi:hypothetical protein